MDNNKIVGKYLNGDFEINKNNDEVIDIPIIIEEEPTKEELMEKYLGPEVEYKAPVVEETVVKTEVAEPIVIVEENTVETVEETETPKMDVKNALKGQKILLPNIENVVIEDIDEQSTEEVAPKMDIKNALKGQKIIMPSVKPLEEVVTKEEVVTTNTEEIKEVEVTQEPVFKKRDIYHFEKEEMGETINTERETTTEGSTEINLDKELQNIVTEEFDEKEELNPVVLDQEVELPTPADLQDVVNNLPVNEEVKPVTEEYVPLKDYNLDMPTPNVKTDKPKNKVVRIIISLLLVLTVMGCVAAGVLYVFNANYEVLIKKSFTHFNKYNTFSFYDFGLENYELEGQTKVDTDIKIDDFDVIDNVYNYNLKKYDKDYKLSFDVNRHNEEIISSNVVFDDNKIYGFMKDVYDKYLLLTEIPEDTNEITTEEYKVAAKKVFDLFIENIDKESYTSDTTKIKLDNKDQSVRETKLTLTEKEIYTNLKKTIDTLKNDKDVKKVLDAINYEELDLFNTEDVDDNVYTYSIFTKGINHEIVGLDLQAEKETVDYDAWYAQDCSDSSEECYDEAPTKKETYKVEYRKGEKPVVNFYLDDELLQTIKLSIKGNILQIEFNNQTDMVGTLIITKNDMSTKMSLDLSVDGGTTSAILDYKVNKVKEKEYDVNVDLTIKVKNESESYKINVLSENTLKENLTEINKPAEFDKLEDLDDREQEIASDNLITKFSEFLGVGDVVAEDDYYTETY